MPWHTETCSLCGYTSPIICKHCRRPVACCKCDGTVLAPETFAWRVLLNPGEYEGAPCLERARSRRRITEQR